MRTYLIGTGSLYREIEETVGEPFRVLTRTGHILCPWGVTVVPLGQDLTVVDETGESAFAAGWLYAAVQFRARHQRVQLGEFFLHDIREDNHLFEVKRNLEATEDSRA